MPKTLADRLGRISDGHRPKPEDLRALASELDEASTKLAEMLADLEESRDEINDFTGELVDGELTPMERRDHWAWLAEAAGNAKEQLGAFQGWEMP